MRDQLESKVFVCIFLFSAYLFCNFYFLYLSYSMQSLSRVTAQRAEQLSSKSVVGLESQSRGSLKLLLKSFVNKCFRSVLFSSFACFINTFYPNIVNKL